MIARILSKIILGVGLVVIGVLSLDNAFANDLIFYHKVYTFRINNQRAV